MEIGLGAREAVSTQQIDETAMFQTISFIQSQIPRSCDNFAWATDRTSNLARQIMTGRITFEQGNIILESELIQAKNGEIGKLQIIYEEVCVSKSTGKQNLDFKIIFGKIQGKLEITVKKKLF